MLASERKEELLDKISSFLDWKNEWKGLKNRTPISKILVDVNEIDSELKLFEKDELPILECYRNNEEFIVFSTKRIYSCRGILETSCYSDIMEIDQEYIDNLNLKLAPRFVEIKLNLIEGKEMIIDLETGYPFNAAMLLINLLMSNSPPLPLE